MIVGKLGLGIALLMSAQIADANEVSVAIDGVGVDYPACMNVAKAELTFACHRFGAGQGFVVATRNYISSRKPDADGYEKLTVIFKSKPGPGQDFVVPTDKATVFYSFGPSSFPENHGCYGEGGHGRVHVATLSDSKVNVDVSVDFDMKSPLGWLGECKNKIHVTKRVNANLIQMNQLNPWLGQTSMHPNSWEEAHPSPGGP